MTEAFRAYAKINLFLDIVGKRSDGYHNIRSVMQTVDLFDTVELRVSEEETDALQISISCNHPDVPCDSGNLAYRAAALFYRELGAFRRTHIAIEKRIPMAAGLAGGSTDAAAVLRGLNVMLGEPFSIETLCSLGKSLGADIPFCILGGTAEVSGIGDRLRILPSLIKVPIVVVKHGEGVSTPQAYRALDTLYHDFKDLNGKGTASDGAYQMLMEGIQSENASAAMENLYNIFEGVILPTHSCAKNLKERLLEYGAHAALMSGSGPSVFGFFADFASAQAVASRLNREIGAEVAFAALPVSP